MTVESQVNTYAIDHQTDVGNSMYAEREDTNANPQGIFREEQANTGVPPWVYDDFNIRENVNPETGEIRYFVNPKPLVVNLVAKQAPERVQSGMGELDETDIRLAAQLAEEMRSYMQTAIAVDEFFANAPLYHLRSELANSAVRATRWLKTVKSGLSRIKEGQETPDWIDNMINMIRDTNRRCAILATILGELESDYLSKMRYDSAAWQVMGQEARKHAQTYFSAPSDKENAENNNNASIALAAGL